MWKHLLEFDNETFDCGSIIMNKMYMSWLHLTKIKSMEGSRSMTFTHNVDKDMIKIIAERKFIYFIIAIFEKKYMFVKLNKYMFV